MEKKKKHKKSHATASSQEPDSKNLLSKEEQNQSDKALAAKKTTTGSPLQENLSSLNEQSSHIFQWPYSTQQGAEQSSLNPRPCAAPIQSTLHVPPWQQVATLQPNSPNHPVQQGQPTVHLAQSAPFWLPQRPSYHFPGVPATFQPFTSISTVDAGWRPSAIIGRMTPRSQDQVPNISYHFGPYPGFPGTWDPSAWWAHGQQSQALFSYTFPEANYGYFSSAPPPMPNGTATFEESSQRGIIRPATKLSQKHQQLWEAQSAENVQLWSVIGKLQSEIADYKSRLTELEAEISALKPSADEPTAQVVRIGLSRGGASKRGRPNRSVASIDVSASPDESHPRARVKKPAASKVQHAARVLVFEKVAHDKLEDTQKTANPASSPQRDNGEKIPFFITNSRVNLEVNGSNLSIPAFHNQVHQEVLGTKIFGIDNNSSFEMKSKIDKQVDDYKAALSVLPQQPKENNNVVSVTQMGAAGTNGETLAWHASAHPEDQPRRNIYNTISQSFYDNSCVIREAGKMVPGWSFVKEEDASDELGDAVVASAKDENEEEKGDDDDDVSSAAEEMAAQAKDESAYKMDTAVGTNPKDLPQCNNW